jgi:type I restriction enzyme S subunit
LSVVPTVNHRYLRYYLLGEDAQRYFKRVARGVAVKGVNIGDVRPTPVLLPPRGEQDRIVAEVERRLSVADALMSEVGASLARCAALRQSILKKAFEGRLVPQDATAEPAMAMLDQLKAQVMTAGPRPRPSRRNAEGNHA